MSMALRSFKSSMRLCAQTLTSYPHENPFSPFFMRSAAQLSFIVTAGVPFKAASITVMPKLSKTEGKSSASQAA